MQTFSGRMEDNDRRTQDASGLSRGNQLPGKVGSGMGMTPTDPVLALLRFGKETVIVGIKQNIWRF